MSELLATAATTWRVTLATEAKMRLANVTAAKPRARRGCPCWPHHDSPTQSIDYQKRPQFPLRPKYHFIDSTPEDGHFPRGQSSWGRKAFAWVKQPHTRQRKPVWCSQPAHT